MYPDYSVISKKRASVGTALLAARKGAGWLARRDGAAGWGKPGR